MMFWAMALAMMVAVAALLVLALRRGDPQAEGAQAYDLRVYRDQLREVERDLARGVVSDDEAARLRVEIGRRVLAADQADMTAGVRASGPNGAVVMVVLCALVVGAALASYLAAGRPGAPDLPLAQRLADADAARRARPSQAEAEAGMPVAAAPEIEPRHAALMAQLREVVAQRPDDMQGHALLARNEASLGNYAAAHAAQARVVALQGAAVQVEDTALLADLMIRATGGYVSPEAEAVLATTLRLNPADAQTRYYTGLMFLQNDRPDRTFQLWSRLWQETRPGDPWAALLERQLPDVAWLAGQHKYQMPPLPGAGPGPDAGQIAAAAEMTEEERTTMVRGMVDRLSERLASDGGPAQDWARLIRALGVLGEGARAQAIYAEAATLFADAPADLAALREAALAAGVSP